MVDHIKELFHLVKKQLDDRLKELKELEIEQGKRKLSTKTSDEDANKMNYHTSSKSSSVVSSSSSSATAPAAACALSLVHNNDNLNIIKPQHQQPPAAEGKKKRRYIYAPSTMEILEASSSPLSISLYSEMQLPEGCLAEHDGCDDAELIARAKRCREILKLYQQVMGAEAAKARFNTQADNT